MTRVLVVVLWAALAATDVLAQDTGPLPSGDARISGRVIDAASGLPVAGARVDLRVTPGASPATAVTTDPSGAFAIAGFKGGSYRLAATRPGYVEPGPFSATAVQFVTVAEGQHLEALTIRLRRAAVLTGTIVDEYGEPVDGISVYAQKIQYGNDGLRTAAPAAFPDKTDDLGQFRLFGLPPGDYLIAASGRNARAELGIPLLMGPVSQADTVPTYYPGTPRLGNAQVVSLAEGEERSLHFALSHVRPVTVSGVVVTSQGRPAAGMRVNVRTMAGQSMTVRGVGTTAANGTFAVPSVSPGSYWIEISPPPGAPGGERGSRQVDVDSEDVAGLTIELASGASISGTVVFDGSARPGTFQVQARPVESLGGTVPPGFSDVVDGDGRFTVRNVGRQVFLEPANELWMTASVTVDGRELGEEPLDLGDARSISGVRVTVTDRLTDVSGGVTDDRGGFLAAHRVVFLRLDATGLPPDQRVRVLTTSATGQFHVHGLRPGSYAVGVVSDLDSGHQFSPDFQEALRANGRKLSLGRGEPVILELGVTTGL